MIRVLIAEDDVTLGSAYKAKLTMEGMEAEVALDGEEALKKANEWNPDVILLDLMMPKMSGIDFLKAYDVKKNHPNVKVIVFSNLATVDTTTEAFQWGALRYLPKSSTTPNAIVATIKELVESAEPTTAINQDVP